MGRARGMLRTLQISSMQGSSLAEPSAWQRGTKLTVLKKAFLTAG